MNTAVMIQKVIMNLMRKLETGTKRTIDNRKDFKKLCRINVISDICWQNEAWIKK